MEIPDGIKKGTGVVAFYRFRKRRDNPHKHRRIRSARPP